MSLEDVPSPSKNDSGMRWLEKASGAVSPLKGIRSGGYAPPFTAIKPPPSHPVPALEPPPQGAVVSPIPSPGRSHRALATLELYLVLSCKRQKLNSKQPRHKILHIPHCHPSGAVGSRSSNNATGLWLLYSAAFTFRRALLDGWGWQLQVDISPAQQL